jgi:hypothetical protein
MVRSGVPDPDLPVGAASLTRSYARHSRRVLLIRRNGALVAELARSELEAFAEHVNYPDLAS